MAELKPCPFCKCPLIMKHINYISIERTVVDFDIWEHPSNGCVLADRVCEMDALQEKDIELWNRRAEDGN